MRFIGVNSHSDVNFVLFVLFFLLFTTRLVRCFIDANGMQSFTRCCPWHHVFILAHLENQVKIASFGGIEVIISAMKKYSDHKEIQDSGYLALCRLASSSGVDFVWM